MIVNNGTRIGLSNVYIKTDNNDYIQLENNIENVALQNTDINQELLDEFKMITTPTEISMKLYASKHSGELSKCLYYMQSKNKRIRKKYAKKMYRLLGGK